MTKDTKYKIGESEFFLKMVGIRCSICLSENEQYDDTFNELKYFVGAFLCSARSVLDYMKEEHLLRKHENDLKNILYYYAIVYGSDQKNNFDKLLFDDKTLRPLVGKGRTFGALITEQDKEIDNISNHFIECRYLFTLRNKAVHSISKRWYPACQFTIDCPFTVTIVRDGNGTDQPGDQSPAQSLASQPTHKLEKIVFQQNPPGLEEDKEVVEFCERNLNVIKQMVKLCEEGKFDLPNLMEISVHSNKKCCEDHSNCLDC
jgi:hypothetical protein